MPPPGTCYFQAVHARGRTAEAYRPGWQAERPGPSPCLAEMMVPALPCRRASALPRLPVAVIRPVASTNRQQASSFGPMDPAGEGAGAHLPWCRVAGRPGGGGAEAVDDGFDVGEEQRVGVPGSAGCLPSR